MIFKRTMLLVLALMVTIALVACANTQEKADNTPAKTAVRIAYFPNINHAQALLAKDQKMFEKEMGPLAQVSYKTFNSGTPEIEAFFAKALDLGYIGPGPAIDGYIKSKGDLVIIAGAANGGSMLVARKGLVFNSPRDFAGKTIGVPNFGNTQDLMLRNLLAENKIKDVTKGGTVKITQVDNPDVKGLFDQKQLDMALVPEPWGTVLVEDCKAKIIYDEKSLWRNGNYPTTVIVARKEFIEKHPDLVEAFLRADMQATNMLKNNSPEALKSVNRQIAATTGKALPDSLLQKSVSRIIFTNNLDMSALNDFSQVMEKLEIIPANSSLSGIYDGAPIKSAIKQQ